MAAGRKHFGGSLSGPARADRRARRHGRRAAARRRARGRRDARRRGRSRARRPAAARGLPAAPQRRSRARRSALVLGAKERGEAISVGLVANIADVMDALLERGITPDIVTDQTTTDPIRGYIPRGMTAPEADELRGRDRDELIRRADATLIDHIRAMLEFQRRGAEVFEYGNGLRARAELLGVDGRLRDGRVHGALHPAALLRGRRAVPLARDLGRPAGHLRDRRHHPRAASRASRSRDWITRRARGRAVHRPARRASAGSATATAASSGLLVNDADRERAHLGPDRVHARPPRLGLGRRARCARPSACATAPTASPTGRS